MAIRLQLDSEVCRADLHHNPGPGAPASCLIFFGMAIPLGPHGTYVSSRIYNTQGRQVSGRSYLEVPLVPYGTRVRTTLSQKQLEIQALSTNTTLSQKRLEIQALRCDGETNKHVYVYHGTIWYHGTRVRTYVLIMLCHN